MMSLTRTEPSAAIDVVASRIESAHHSTKCGLKFNPLPGATAVTLASLLVVRVSKFFSRLKATSSVSASDWDCNVSDRFATCSLDDRDDPNSRRPVCSASSFSTRARFPPTISCSSGDGSDRAWPFCYASIMRRSLSHGYFDFELFRSVFRPRTILFALLIVLRSWPRRACRFESQTPNVAEYHGQQHPMTMR